MSRFMLSALSKACLFSCLNDFEAIYLCGKSTVDRFKLFKLNNKECAATSKFQNMHRSTQCRCRIPSLRRPVTRGRLGLNLQDIVFCRSIPEDHTGTTYLASNGQFLNEKRTEPGRHWDSNSSSSVLICSAMPQID